ncbi:MAG: segregation/condensation protein A [Clostridiales bacterium]|nr:segregation/condensation protein A [Clostridiales bacterium]
MNFKVMDFEGPLDLLLTLIRKNKVSIYDIPISLIVEQYFDVMREMKEYDIDISSEFLVLAATLLQIKSKMLLPKPEPEDEEDPREELVKRLLEYKKAKAAAEYLNQRKHIGETMFCKQPDKIERPPAEWNYSRLTPENLVLAYKQAYQKLERRLPPPKHSFSGIVGHEKVSVRARVKRIWDKLVSRTRMFFKELFISSKSKPEAVADFLAVLEMVKLNRINVEYDEDGDISNPIVTMGDNAELDLNMIED